MNEEDLENVGGQVWTQIRNRPWNAPSGDLLWFRLIMNQLGSQVGSRVGIKVNLNLIEQE